MSDAGYVRLYRSLLGHAAFRNDAEAMAFAWMIARAAWRPVRVRYKERSIELARGQLVTSVRDLATALDRDKAWVERLLGRMRTERMIETSRGTSASIITIVNYDAFQGSTDGDESSFQTPKKRDTRETPDETAARTERETVGNVVNIGNDTPNRDIREVGETAPETHIETAPRNFRDTEQRIEKEKLATRESAPSEFELRCRSLATLINLTRPIAASDRDQVRAWLREGFHFEWHIIEGARAVVARGVTVRSFKYLDGGIREYRAEWQAERDRLVGAAR